MITTAYNAIYLAPHLDDAALSCGGDIFQRTNGGARVLIVTVMAGPPPPGDFSAFASELHARWELPEAATVVRRREDAAACRCLGAEYDHWELPDAVYRRDPVNDNVLYPTWEDVLAGIAAGERPLINQLAARFRQLPPAQTIFSPLTVGNHVDHLLVRAAAEQAFGDELLYYEDFPYAREGFGVMETLAQTDTNWTPVIFPLSERALGAKAQSILAYRSQLSTFFTDEADLHRQLVRHATAVGGERSWRQTGTNVANP